MALVWFFCLGGLGVWFPLVSLYLDENAGLSGSQVGLVLALIPLMGIVAQPLWGQVADRSGSRTRVLSVVTLGAAAGYALVGEARGLLPIAASVAAMAFFASAMLPMTFPSGVPSRMNLGQVLETHLGLAAHKLHFRAVTPVFDGATDEDIRDAL